MAFTTSSSTSAAHREQLRAIVDRMDMSTTRLVLNPPRHEATEALMDRTTFRTALFCLALVAAALVIVIATAHP